jgi:hypothetical protein
MPFDTIELRRVLGPEPIELEQLLALTLADRVRLLAEGRLSFFHEGERVDPQVALRAIFAPRRSPSVTMRVGKPGTEER